MRPDREEREFGNVRRATPSYAGREVPGGGAWVLPTFDGYTVDVRCSEFRKITGDALAWEWVRFASPEGERLLARYLPTLPLEESLDIIAKLKQERANAERRSRPPGPR